MNELQTVEFTKMHGLGNDFIVIDNVRQTIFVSEAQLKQLADRNFGVGCDQIIILNPPAEPDSDFAYKIFNADGLPAGQCGNGVRCLARFVHDEGLCLKPEVVFDSPTGKIAAKTSQYPRFCVNMGVPRFKPNLIPTKLKPMMGCTYEWSYKGHTIEGQLISMGNPHFIINKPEVRDLDFEQLGKDLQSDPAFPQGVNVSVLDILALNHVSIRIFERGVGPTLACGTAACAAAVAGIRAHGLSKSMQVDMPGGYVTVDWPTPNHPVALTGPTASVFKGKVILQNPGKAGKVNLMT